MTISLSPDQADAVARVAEWFSAVGRLKSGWCSEDHDGTSEDGEGLPHTHGHTFPAPVLSVGGLAGSGKTTIVRTIDDALGVVPVFGTPTHKAAAVLRGKLDAERAEHVRTYHSIVYQSRTRYRCDGTGATVRPVGHGCSAEEAQHCDHPMTFHPCEAPGAGAHQCPVSEELRFERRETLGGYRDLVVIDEASMLSEEQVDDVRSLGVPVLLVGDHGQLPPVKAAMNPWMLAPDALLTGNHRQGEASGIIGAALTARGGSLPFGTYGESAAVVPRSDPRVDGLLARWRPSRDAALIVPTNRLRARMNQRYHGAGPVRGGDLVVALQRCPMVPVLTETGVATGQLVTVQNGATGVVVQVRRVQARRTDLLVALDDGPRVLVTCATEQFGLDRSLMRNEYPAGARLWDYAYAVTAHKAQGSEYERVLVMGEPWGDYGRWMYTAVTRARERLVVVRNG